MTGDTLDGDVDDETEVLIRAPKRTHITHYHTRRCRSTTLIEVRPMPLWKARRRYGDLDLCKHCAGGDANDGGSKAHYRSLTEAADD